VICINAQSIPHASTHKEAILASATKDCTLVKLEAHALVVQQ